MMGKSIKQGKLTSSKIDPTLAVTSRSGTLSDPIFLNFNMIPKTELGENYFPRNRYDDKRPICF